MADNKVENADVAEEVCCVKEKPTVEKKDEKKETAVKPTVDEEKEEKDAEEKAENGDAKEENGKEEEEGEDETENDKEADSDVKTCKRKSTSGDASNGVEATTPEKKQKLETNKGEEKETEVAA